MQYELNQDGTRNTQYRPRILLEESTFNSVHYNPFDSYNYGLYHADHSLHESWTRHTSNHINGIISGGKVRHVRPPDHLIHTSQPYQLYGTNGERDQYKGRGLYRRLHAT